MTYIFFWEEELSESISRKTYFRYFVTYLRLSHYGTPVSDSLHNFGQMTPYLPIDVVFCCIGQIKSHLNFFLLLLKPMASSSGDIEFLIDQEKCYSNSFHFLIGHKTFVATYLSIKLEMFSVILYQWQYFFLGRCYPVGSKLNCQKCFFLANHC